MGCRLLSDTVCERKRKADIGGHSGEVAKQVFSPYLCSSSSNNLLNRNITSLQNLLVKWPRGRYTRPAFLGQAIMHFHCLGPPRAWPPPLRIVASTKIYVEDVYKDHDTHVRGEGWIEQKQAEKEHDVLPLSVGGW